MTDKPGPQLRKTTHQYLRYSGLAVQLFVLMAVAAWLGRQVDKWLRTDKPYFTILFILFFTAGFFYRLIKDLNRKDEP